ncbi:unnamed protein product, partial [Didymodactylos carnosus]
MVPYALVKIEQGKTMISVFNTTNTHQKIQAGAKLGVIQNHFEEICYAVNPSPSCPTRSFSQQLSHLTSSQQFSSITTSVEKLISHLSSSQQRQLKPILLKHANVFDTSKPTIVNVGIQHRIPVKPHHHPTQSRAYRKAPKEREIESL